MTTSDIIDRLDQIRFQLTFDGPRGVSAAIEKLTLAIRRDGLKSDLLIGGDCVAINFDAERERRIATRDPRLNNPDWIRPKTSPEPA